MLELNQTAAEGATAIQVLGDNVTVRIVRGGAVLALDKLHARKAEPKTVMQLLLTETRATTFLGRETALCALAEWRAAPQSIAIRCITGEAGAGKTRLAIEVCEAAEAEGWEAGFAASAELARFHKTQNLLHWNLPRNVLIVIDYAATSLPVLKEWFAALASAPARKDGCRLRILLLERQADPVHGWWAELNRRESIAHFGPADLVGADAIMPLPPLVRTADRRTLLAETMRTAAPLLDPPARPIAPPPVGADPWFDKRIEDNRIDNEPLFLMMAGVHAVRHGAPSVVALDRGTLAQEMVEIEAARLAKFAHAHGFADDGTLLTHLAACVTLQNGCPLGAVTTLIAEEITALGLTTPLGAETVAKRLGDALQISEAAIAPIRPDLIGEAFVIETVQGGRFRDEATRRAIVLRAYRRSRVGTVGTLIRGAIDFADGKADHAAVRWLRVIAEASSNWAELALISDLVPASTLAMREFAADLAHRIAVGLREAANTGNNVARWSLGTKLNVLAVRLSDLGRREEAVAVAEEAASLFRALAATPVGSFAYMPFLAESLSNLARGLSNLGQREEALMRAEEAVTLWRTLVAAYSDAFTPHLAGALDSLANVLRALGRTDEALAAVEEAVTLNRALAASRPDAFTPNLAASRDSLANVLCNLGRHKEALTAVEESVCLFRVLAASRPDAFTPYLAGSLNNLAIVLCELGQPDEALAAVDEAVKLRRPLAAARPDAFAPDLATSLALSGGILAAAGRVTDAIACNEEAVRILAPTFFAHPAVFARAMAKHVADYVSHCGQAGRESDAELLGPVEEALAKGTDAAP